MGKPYDSVTDLQDAVKIMRCGAKEGIPSFATRCLYGQTGNFPIVQKLNSMISVRQHQWVTAGPTWAVRFSFLTCHLPFSLTRPTIPSYWMVPETLTVA